MNVLVTGGAGYIGSHAVKRFLDAGHHVVALDNLARGHRAAVPAHVPFEELDLRQTEAVSNALTHHRIEAVCHFAALAYVGESVEEPLRYYDNNCVGSLSLLRSMQTAGVKRIVFSSTAATYGQPESMPIHETTPQRPINPYGFSKLAVERMLFDLAAADETFAFASFRYFNVAGCARDGTLGEDHEPETHLIPVLLLTAMGRRPHVTIYGDDYPTEDGTCIRDFVHVEDLVNAHVGMAERLEPGDRRTYNLGIGRGHSVKQVVDAARHVTGEDIPVRVGPRRPGDPATLFANADKAREELSWEAAVTDINQIVDTAWRWFRNHPDGYRAP